MIAVRWKSHIFRAGWQVQESASQKEYLFGRLLLHKTPRNVRDPDLDRRMEELVRGNDLSNWWHEKCGAPGQKLFVLHFRDGAWDIPWEWLVGRLSIPENKKKVSIIRTLEDEPPAFAPSRFERPLRILILHGENGASIGAKLDLETETSAVTDAWAGLEHAVKRRVDRPNIAQANLADLPSLLATEPDLIWFSGHGRHKPKPGLLFANGVWVSPEDVQAAVFHSPWKPKFWLLMACDTARGGRTLESMPAFVTQLFNLGSLNVLGMQAPIGDVSARILAQEIFSGLAIGLSLEVALARARALLSSTITETRNRTDWASPVIWTSTRPVERWEWNTADDSIVQLQVLGRESLRGGRSNTSQLDPSSTESELTIANAWIGNSRTWVVSDSTGAETRTRWIRTLKAIQQTEPLYIVEIDRGTTDIELSLQRWAEVAHGNLLPGHVPDEFARALLLLRSQPIAGWNNLLRVRSLFLGVFSPPEFDPHSWFWSPLLELQDLKVAVLSNATLPQTLVGKWAVDRIESTMDAAIIAETIERAPRLARAIALLREPLGYSLIRLDAAETDEPLGLSQWQGWNSVLVEVPGGPLMSATARQAVLARSTEDQLKAAHVDCGRMLSNPEIPLTVRLREETLFHAVQAADWGPALVEAEALCYWYRDLGRAASVVSIVRLLGSHARELNGKTALRVAWAFAQLGDVATSDFWLRRARPDGALEQAWLEGLRAELKKSQGDREGAANAIDEAIKICSDALRRSPNQPEVQRRLRNYRQDRARIRHFLFYDLEGAEHAYQELIKEWNGDPVAQMDLAVVLRNHAECLRSLASGHNDGMMLQARDELNRAETIIRPSGDTPVLAEVLYEQAKMAERLGHPGEARDFLQKTIETARRSGHYQIEAIARSRLFWQHDAFSLQVWRQIDSDLAVHPTHGWPVRTLLTGRLHAAQTLERQDQKQTALEILDAAQSVIDRNPWLQGRSDRFRICATAAGRQVLNDSLGISVAAWTDFEKTYTWSQEYLASQRFESPDEAWAKVRES